MKCTDQRNPLYHLLALFFAAIAGALALILLMSSPQQAATLNLSGLNLSGETDTADVNPSLISSSFEDLPAYKQLTDCAPRITGKIASGWKDNTCWEPTSQVIYAKDTSNPHSGGASQRIQLIAGRVQFIPDMQITMQSGTLYTATFWLRAQAPMTVILEFMKKDSPYTSYGYKEVALTTAWQRYTVIGMGDGNLGLLMLRATKPGTFWVDDATLVSAPFSNLSFEDPPVYRQLTDCTPRITGMIAGGWKDNTCWEPTSQVLYAKDTSNPHSGGTSQRIQLIASLVQFIQDVPISMQGGTLYTGTFWLRADRDPMTVTLKFMKQDSPYTIYGSKDVRLNTTWQPYTVTGLGEGYLSVLMLSTTTRGTFWVDDANLISAPLTLQPPTATITRTFFGMHFHSSTIPLTAVHKPIGAIRLWNIDGPGSAIAQWSGIHISGGITVSGVYSPGVFKWDGLDAHVNRALAHQADLIMNLGRMPKWASANPSAAMNCNGDTYSTGPLKDIRDWRNWVAAAGNRYKGKIRYWEIWNEPDVSDNNVKCNWSGSAKDLAILTKEAYAILKKIDPNNQIISPSPGILGPLSITEPNYLDSYLKELKVLSGTVDIIGYHTYIAEAPESQTWKYIPDLRSISQKYGFANTPLWNTESGWLMADVSASQAAAYVSRAHILDWAMGIKRHYFYAWDEVNKLGIELVDDAGTFQHLTAAGNAYIQTAQWLNGATMTSVKIATNNTWVVELRRGTSNYGYIVWNPTAWETGKPISFTLPASVQWKHELSGIVSAVSGGTVVAIDDKPVLFDSSAQLAGFTLTDSEEPIVSENPDTAAESTHTLYLPIISQEVE